jgi:MerR family redox-sensitive transcriptional activator SoxR
MKIGDVAKRTGLPPSTIRFYEREGLLPAPARRGGQRVFGKDALDQLRVVQLARDAGFRVGEIRQLVTEFGRDRWRRLAERKLDELRQAADRLAAMTDLLGKLLRCRCPDIEFCGRQIARHDRRGKGGRRG